MKKKKKGNDDETRTAWKVDEIPRRVEGCGGKKKRNGGKERKEEGKKKGGKKGDESKERSAIEKRDPEDDSGPRLPRTTQ